ncbi:MAG: ATP-binding protein [Polyangiales bacterium]
MSRNPLGLRAQMALALTAVLVLAAALALLAIRPLMARPGRVARTRLGLTLSRAVAGEVNLTPPERVPELLRQSIGEAGLSGAALYDHRGQPLARAGVLRLSVSRHPPPHDRVSQSDEYLSVVVLLPSRGVFVAETSLTPGAFERTVPTLMLLYTSSAGLLALMVVYLLLTRFIVRPVEGLTRAAERVAAGRRDVVAEERGAAEVVRAASAFNRMTEQLGARERSLTEREAELEARVKELERATRDLRRAQEQSVRNERLAVVGRLAAGIAHEVGNPLAAIVGLSDVMVDGGLDDDETREFASRIGQEAQRIHRTVRELLDYARVAPPSSQAPPAADGTPAQSQGEVGEAIEQVVRLLRPQKALKEVSIAVDVEEGIAPVALATDRLVQVILNLALNAADALRGAGRAEGSITLRARALDERAVVVEVEDDGPGIPPAVRERIFEPFFTTKPAGEGTGLGLPTSQAIVEQAGGAMRAEERRDGKPGAVMVAELPVVGARLTRETLL